jgi:integrase
MHRLSLIFGYVRMLGKQAKVLAPPDLADLLAFADCSRHSLRNRVVVLLSTKAGLRAGEIASLTWDMVLDASGQISKTIELRDRAAKKGSGRLIPMHADLADALSILLQASRGINLRASPNRLTNRAPFQTSIILPVTSPIRSLPFEIRAPWTGLPAAKKRVDASHALHQFQRAAPQDQCLDLSVRVADLSTMRSSTP